MHFLFEKIRSFVSRRKHYCIHRYIIDDDDVSPKGVRFLYFTLSFLTNQNKESRISNF